MYYKTGVKSSCIELPKLMTKWLPFVIVSVSRTKAHCWSTKRNFGGLRIVKLNGTFRHICGVQRHTNYLGLPFSHQEMLSSWSLQLTYWWFWQIWWEIRITNPITNTVWITSKVKVNRSILNDSCWVHACWFQRTPMLKHPIDTPKFEKVLAWNG